MLLQFLACMLFSLAFTDVKPGVVVNETSVKTKASPTDISIDEGDFQTFNFDLAKPFRIVTEPSTAKVIADSNGKKVSILGYGKGPDVVSLYVIMDNDFFYRCNVRIIKNKKEDDGKPKPSPYLARLKTAFDLDGGKVEDIKQLAAIYRKLVDNYSAFNNIKTVWEWMEGQYYTAKPGALALTRSTLQAIQKETILQYESEALFTAESREASLKVYTDIATALEVLAGGKVDPQPQPDPLPKSEALWLVVVEDVEDRSIATAAVLSDLLNLGNPKVTYRQYSRKDPSAKNYVARAIEKNINTSSGQWRPVMLLIDRKTNQLIDIRALPAKSDEVKTILTGVLGK